MQKNDVLSVIQSFVMSVVFISTLSLQEKVHGQVNIFDEDMGAIAVSANTAITEHTGFRYFGSEETIYSGNGDVRTTTASSGYPLASGGNCVFLTSTIMSQFEINNINIDGGTNLSISFGIQKSTVAEDGAGISILASVDGGTAIPLPLALPTGTGSTAWQYRTPSVTLPEGKKLNLTFAKTASGGASFRIDDILIQSQTPLPVALSEFKAQYSGNKVRINWATGGERNISHFALKRSEDATAFHSIAEVSAQQQPHGASYMYEDISPGKDMAYYRLTTIDLDGERYYSPVIKLSKPWVPLSVSLKATLVRNRLTIVLNHAADQPILFNVLSINGALLQQHSIDRDGNGEHTLDVSGLSSGMYLLQVSGTGHESALRFIKEG